jgi:transcriptional regulator with XRE-family HTH domain
MKRTKLSKIRQSRELSQKKVSDDLGISRKYLSEIERGIRTPSFPLACSFQKYFGIDACTLLQRDGDDEQ